MKTKFTLALFAFILMFNVPISSTTYFVRSATGSDSNDGLTPASAFLSLGKAVNLSLTDGDVINISGTFNYAELNKFMLKSISIVGDNKSTAIIKGTLPGANFLSIGNSATPVSVLVENVTIQDFDFWDGSTQTEGGVFRVYKGSTLTCKNVNFINNQAVVGGAVNLLASTGIFEDCYFYNNRAKLRPSVNTNAFGAAIQVNAGSSYSEDASLTVDRCLFEDNSTDNSGAAIRYIAATKGAANLLIQNSTFVGNTLKGSNSTTGGSIQIQVTSEVSDIKIINNTIAYNYSEFNNVTALAGLSVSGNDDKLILMNNILYSNTNAAGASVSILNTKKNKESRNNITDQDYDFEANTTSGASSSNFINVTGEALGLSSSLSDNGGETKTLAINATSVAVNAGYSTGAPLVDQRNIARVGNPDVGAYENLTTTTGSNNYLSGIKYSQLDGETIFKNLEGFKTVKVYDTVGKLVTNVALFGDSYRLIANSGIYFLHFEGTNKHSIIKLIVK